MSRGVVQNSFERADMPGNIANKSNYFVLGKRKWHSVPADCGEARGLQIGAHLIPVVLNKLLYLWVESTALPKCGTEQLLKFCDLGRGQWFVAYHRRHPPFVFDYVISFGNNRLFLDYPTAYFIFPNLSIINRLTAGGAVSRTTIYDLQFDDNPVPLINSRRLWTS